VDEGTQILILNVFSHRDPDQMLDFFDERFSARPR
jgi:hypothetical protein